MADINKPTISVKLRKFKALFIKMLRFLDEGDLPGYGHDLVVGGLNQNLSEVARSKFSKWVINHTFDRYLSNLISFKVGP
jgi:hypothetical protein